ncbi:MAG: hypothetical protein AAGA81_05830 [Acidobacteriota bacterium]
MRPAPKVAWLACCLSLAGCSFGPAVDGHREFSRGDFAAARTSYEAALARGVDDAEVLLRLAVAYLVTSPDDPRAEELLRQVATGDVGGPYRPVASLLIALKRDLGESQQEVAAVRRRVDALEAELEQRSALIESLQGEGRDSGKVIDALERSKSQLRRRLAESQELLQAETAKVKSLRAELQKLKEIDLGRPPG